MLFEVFTTNEDESDALKTMMNIEENVKEKAKQKIKQMLGSKGLNIIKKAVNK